MKTTLQELPQNRVRLEVEVPVADVDHAFEHALHDLSSSVRMPGFRKGKAPAALVKQRIGLEALRDEALESHLSGWYQRAVAVAGIDPIDRPTIDWDDAPAEGEPFAFNAEVEVKPKPEVKSYTGLDGVRIPPEVPREAIDSELERLRLSVAELVPVERGAEEGDFAVIDFVGSIDGAEFEGGKGSDYGIELGGGRLLPDLERGIQGMKAGDERDVTVAFPADYPAENLAGKVAQFHVTAKEVKERRLPELDDEFAKSVSEFDKLSELEADITNSLQDRVQVESDQLFRQTVLASLGRELATPLPEAIVRSRMSEMARNLIDDLAAAGDDHRAVPGDHRPDFRGPGQRAAAAGRGVRGARPRPRGGGRRRERRGRRRAGRGLDPRAGGVRRGGRRLGRRAADGRRRDADRAAHRPASSESPGHRGR